MAVMRTNVAKSRDIKDAALNLNLKAYEVRRTLAAVWDVRTTAAEPPTPEAAMSLDMTNDSQESVVGGSDERKLVDKAHFAPGGKYRSIVKLFIHYEFQDPGQWAMGTGWLIKPDIFVTAGHCSYDWSHKFGRATEVKAYIGYSGRQSEKTSAVEFRRVKRIVTTEGWVKTRGQKSFDVSFMQVEAPFTRIDPIRYDETPSRGNLTLGVVGYPGDLYDKQTGEKGARMYEMFLPTEYDLSTQTDTMLEYQIDTYGGNSGSPVLRHHDLVSIGAHVYGGTFNSASVIGKYGNPYEDYLAAFGLRLPDDALNLIPVTGNTAISAPVPTGYGSSIPSGITVADTVTNGIGKSRTNESHNAVQAQRVTPRLVSPLPQASSQNQRRNSLMAKLIDNDRVVQGRKPNSNRALAEAEAEEEGFMDLLKTVAGALPTGLGMVGGPIGALAGFALNAAATQLTAETTESAMNDSDLHEGSMERAILAEATLSALQQADLPRELEEGIFGDMKDMVMKALPTIREAAPRVMGAMMEPALKIALDSLQGYNRQQAFGAESFEQTGFQPYVSSIAYSSAIDQPADHQTGVFLSHLQASLQQNRSEAVTDDDSEEGIFDLIKAGCHYAGKGVLAAAKHGLPILVDVLKQTSGAESFEDQSSSGPTRGLFAADPLAQRALLADAALQAVMKLPPQQLEEEGIFDFIGSAVRTIAPIAMRAIPTVARAIHPTVGSIVSSVLGQESALDVKSTGPRRVTARPSPGGVSSKRSLYSLRDGTSQNDEPRSRFNMTGPNGSRFGQRY